MLGGTMAISEEHLRRAVDDVLEPAWLRERRRAARRLFSSTLGRVVGGLLALWVLALVVYLLTGVMVPWTFFVFMTVLMTVTALSDRDSRAHFRRN
jgi:hypothetical protein